MTTGTEKKLVSASESTDDNTTTEIKKKLCSRCGDEKTLDNYYNDSKSSDGKQSQCNICKRIRKPRAKKTEPSESLIAPVEINPLNSITGFDPATTVYGEITVSKEKTEKKKQADKKPAKVKPVKSEPIKEQEIVILDDASTNPVPAFKTRVEETYVTNNTTQPNAGNKYSKTDLNEFRQIILDKISKTSEQLNILRDAISGKSGNGTSDTGSSLKSLEDSADLQAKEDNALLASRQEKFLNGLKNALDRINRGTYGICQKTGKLIPKERLRVVPHATTTIEVKANQE